VEEFCTPPSSPKKHGSVLQSSSGDDDDDDDDGDGDMSIPEEGPVVFIQG
jgi:hypothetical protein